MRVSYLPVSPLTAGHRKGTEKQERRCRRSEPDLRELFSFTTQYLLRIVTGSSFDGFWADVPEPQEAVFVVAGHTDSQGPEAYNDELGQRRAASVARYLLSKGVDPLRVTVVSYGERLPVADNGTVEGRRKNRRVEIVVYKEVIGSGGEVALPPPQARQRN